MIEQVELEYVAVTSNAGLSTMCLAKLLAMFVSSIQAVFSRKRLYTIFLPECGSAWLHPNNHTE